ncbi:multidrug ABC transporter ATP-binding protein [Microbispora rosea subsp. aerata]|nr:ABC transporter ATP-binding protein [Microbispora rosea]GGO00624.1 multidrug ABC transporter ATP-binding protein [Microbispora rosea subsp. aerata]GIH56848.1 multidrug ABC transporter ATP-binding protein [Microbispora rosea subsp. aerata]GLJ84332.1 multidrug ABC transporter ATP-binding protein [Microbispora rosea subsp. aerata]
MTTDVTERALAVDVAISATELRQRYGDFEAVKGVSLAVRKGELFALLGTNGAGKTTTMEVLEGYRPATSGTVEVLGMDPYRKRRALSPRVGVMLQENGFLPDLTVAETVGLWRDLHAEPRSLDESLEMAGLADKAGVRIRQLSGGQKRRLDLVLSVIGRPEVLFLDEPTTGMDPEARRATWDLIRDLVKEGTTVLLTTHYLEEAEQLASRLAIMHKGEIQVEGTLEEVIARHGDRISFRLPAEIPLDDLPRIEGHSADIALAGGTPVVTYTITGGDQATRAHTALVPLLAWAGERGVALERLAVRTASLEDVFHSVVKETA